MYKNVLVFVHRHKKVTDMGERYPPAKAEETVYNISADETVREGLYKIKKVPF